MESMTADIHGENVLVLVHRRFYIVRSDINNIVCHFDKERRRMRPRHGTRPREYAGVLIEKDVTTDGKTKESKRLRTSR